tara:strand:- start:161 stop:1186 length:1026 start_codon:yes stop_codon:yes gene_type:complete
MNNFFSLLILILCIFSSCDNSFEVNSNWEEVTIVYGLLDAGNSNSLQEVRINKAFLGQMDAYQMAKYKDSINFDTTNLNVTIYKIKNNTFIDSVTLHPEITVRNGDVFNDTLVTYKFFKDNFLQSSSSYELRIRNKNSQNVVSSFTNIIPNFSWGTQFKPFYNIGFYKNDLSDFDDKQINWRNVDYGQIYQLNLEFNYSEINQISGETTFHSLDWIQPIEIYTSGEMSTKLEGDLFFKFLKDNIQKNNDVERVFESIYIEMTVGTEELNTYINVNKPITGIVQERPVYTNIINGIGLFSSRYTHRDLILNSQDQDNKGLTNATHYYINNQLDRNFNYPFDF